jgi:hypothetical protein
MQRNQNVPRSFAILTQAITYLIGGMFLLTVSAISPSLAGRAGVIAQIFGYIFIVIAILLGISASVNRLAAWANRVDTQFSLALFLVSIAGVFFAVAGSPSKYLVFFIVLFFAFLLIVIAGLLFGSEADLGTRIRSRVGRAGLLRIVSLALSLFALGMVIAQVSIMGGPILYLAISLVCLGVASVL